MTTRCMTQAVYFGSGDLGEIYKGEDCIAVV